MSTADEDEDDLLAQALADFVSDFNAGILPQEAQPWFCGARLIALQKQPTGVRPIAVGETLRRLAGKCLVRRCQDEVIEKLLPHQMGVGIANACEIISHAVRAWAETAAADETLILVDFSNAYNSLDRQKMLEAIAEDAPAFLPYANYCYGAETPLLGKGFTLSSAEGTQQGDCCGPIFFSVTLNRLLRSCCPQTAEAWNRWFLDDGSLCGKTCAKDVRRPRPQISGNRAYGQYLKVQAMGANSLCLHDGSRDPMVFRGQSSRGTHGPSRIHWR